MSEKNPKKTGLVLSCWIAAVLVLLIIFFVKSDEIIRNLRETAFFDRVFGSTPEFIKKHTDKEDTEEKDNGTLPAESASVPGQIPEFVQPAAIPPAGQVSAPDSSVPSAVSGTAGSLTENLTQQEQNSPPVSVTQQPSDVVPQQKDIAKPQEKPVSVKTPVPAKTQVPETMNVKLWFVQIDSDGSVSRKETSRALKKDDSPLTVSIQALLEGPRLDEKGKGYMSLIPSGAQLLSAAVQNGVAILNFNENFEYNTYGVEGYLGQLMQIVFTATSFSTVDSVQFLIEGQKKDYLGSEGVWIGSPLARSSFR
jgi:germination protein M